MRADVLTLLQQKGCGASKVVGDRFRASKKRGESHSKALYYWVLWLLNTYLAKGGTWMNL